MSKARETSAQRRKLLDEIRSLADIAVFGTLSKGAEQATREGVAAWQTLQTCLRELAELNKERNLSRARESDSQ